MLITRLNQLHELRKSDEDVASVRGEVGPSGRRGQPTIDFGGVDAPFSHCH